MSGLGAIARFRVTMTASKFVSLVLAGNQSDRVSKNKSAQDRGCPPPPGHGKYSKFHHKRTIASEKMNKRSFPPSFSTLYFNNYKEEY